VTRILILTVALAAAIIAGALVWHATHPAAVDSMVPACRGSLILPVGKRPIVAFGDSITWGYGASTGCVAGDAPVGNVGAHAEFGSSTTYPGDLSRLLGKSVLNYGLSGEKTSDGLRRLSLVVRATHPSMVVLMEGTNDVALGLPASTTLSALRRMVGLIRAAGARVVLVAPPPVATSYSRTIHDLGTKVTRLAADLKVFAADPRIAWETSMLSPDGVHPNDAGYHAIADAVANAKIS
jgi:acyl-CoA thioesterase I